VQYGNNNPAQGEMIRGRFILSVSLLVSPCNFFAPTPEAGIDRQREENNRKLSKVRVKVEHAISGIKCSRTVNDVLRNTKDGFSDLVTVIACGLHNFRVDHRKKPLKR